MQVKVFCCSYFFDGMLKVKNFFPDLIRKAVEGDITSCFKLCSFRSQCNVEMERQMFIKFGHDDVVLICYKCFAIRISFLEEYFINKLRDRHSIVKKTLHQLSRYLLWMCTKLL